MLGLMRMIKRIVSNNDLLLKPKKDLEECDTCGQLSHLKNGLCDWCQKVYEANK